MDVYFFQMMRAVMFAHEASYDCIFCGSEWCYGTCRDNGVDQIFYGGDKRELEVLPALQAAPESTEGLRDRQEQSGRPAPALPEVSTGLPFVTKTYSRYHLASRYRSSDQDIRTIGAMEYF